MPQEINLIINQKKLVMKQKLILLCSIILLSVSSCRKDSQEYPVENNDYAGIVSTASRPGECRLASASRDNAYSIFFKYNNRGLVSEWKEDYFDGFPYIITYTYDLFGRLKTGQTLNTYDGTTFDVKYIYHGNRLMKHIIYEAGTNTVINEIVNTYNNRGQIIRRGSTMFPVYCTFNYNMMGNNTLVNFYIDGSLYMKEEFTYKQFNRNPYLAAHGIPYVTYLYDFVFSKWWETSEKYTVYDDQGAGTVTLDLDPATAVITMGPQNYLTSITNLDRISGGNTSAYFTYDNCNCTPQRSMSKDKAGASNSKYLALARFRRAFEKGDIKAIRATMKTLLQ